MACWTGCRSGGFASFFCEAYHCGNPSSVVTDLFATAETGVTQERISTPLTSTEHEPHWARPHPKRGPCRRNSLDKTYRSGVSGVAATVHDLSLTLILRSVAMDYFAWHTKLAESFVSPVPL